jgi:polyisoprenoid-binding protein YceI
MRGLRFIRLVALALVSLAVAAVVRADNYQIDPMHTAVTFKVSHLGLSWVHGRFNKVSGNFTIDPDPMKSSFALNIEPDSIDTGMAKRDDHLKSPDFFDIKQFPQFTFKTTAVKPIRDGYEVTGDLTLHGKTKSITFPLLGGREAEFPKGVKRTGYSTELVIKRSDFGMDKMREMIGDEVRIAVSFEGVKK